MLTIKYPPASVKNFPGVTPELSAVAIAALNGQALMPEKYNITHHCYTHFRGVSARAAGSAAERIDFFNQAPAPYVVNTPQQGQINDDEFFWGLFIKIDLLTNVNAATQAVTTAPVTNLTGAAAAPLTVTNAEEARQLIMTGRVNFNIGNRKIVDDVYGIHRFASGSGVSYQGAATGANSTNIYAALAANNGSPDRFNGWACTPAFWLARGRTMSFTLDWNTTNVITTNAFTWAVTLEGIRITTGNV